MAADENHTSRGDYYLQLVGVAHWLAGRESQAASTWYDLVSAMEQGKIDYSDAAGGVESACLLWFAAVRLGQQNLLKAARRLLRKKVKNNRSSNWPGPVAKFLLGRLTPDQLRGKVADVPVLRERELCEAEFYIGVRSLEANDRPAAGKAFRTAAKLDTAKVEKEYYLASHELKRIRGKRRGG